MTKTVVLSVLSVLAAASLVVAPSPSFSASKGRAATAQSGKSTVSPGGKGVERYTKKPDYLELKLRTPTVSSVKKGKTRVRRQELPVIQKMDKSSP